MCSNPDCKFLSNCIGDIGRIGCPECGGEDIEDEEYCNICGEPDRYCKCDINIDEIPKEDYESQG